MYLLQHLASNEQNVVGATKHIQWVGSVFKQVEFWCCQSDVWSGSQYFQASRIFLIRSDEQQWKAEPGAALGSLTM